ncbi:MAG: hypothetical protein CMH54_04150 [Myxococcales bacterium]|nr:hypothetical protein [Myxococcales bacterium]
MSVRRILVCTMALLLAPGVAVADITGFIVNTIETFDAVSLDDRFGASSSAETHEINIEDCYLYNGESSASEDTGTTSSALESDEDTGNTTDTGDAGSTDDVADGGSDDVAEDVAEDVASDIDDAGSESDVDDTGTVDDTTTDATTDTTTTIELPDAYTVRFTVSLTAPFGEDWYYAVKVGSSCDNTSITADPTATCVYVQDKTALDSVSGIDFDVNMRHLIGTLSFEDETESSCSSLLGDAGTNTVYFLIQQGDDGGSLQSQEIPFDYDYDAPAAPTSPVAEAGEGNVTVSWTDDDNSTEADIRYKVYYSTADFDEGDKESVFETDTVATLDIQVADLDNDTEYTFRVVAIDSVDNESDLSEAVTETPVPVDDFFEHYKGQGGREEGGFCAIGWTGRATPLFLLLGLALCMGALLRWRSRFLVVLLAFTISGVVVDEAQAERPSSPVTGTMNLRFGPYVPDIDAEFAADVAGPYESLFDSQRVWVHRLEAGRLLFGEFGRLFLTGEIGYGRATGFGVETETGEKSSDATKMHFIPLSISLVYQFDQLSRRAHVPLVPYVRVGVDYTIWWITDGLDEVSDHEAEDGTESEGVGATHGLHVSFGVRLLLDAFAQDMADGFDEDMGFNDSYLFVEWTDLHLDDYGSDASFILSDQMVSFGLGFDY